MGAPQLFEGRQLLCVPVCFLGQQNLFQQGPTSKGKNMLLEEQILSLIVNPNFEGRKNENGRVTIHSPYKVYVIMRKGVDCLKQAQPEYSLNELIMKLEKCIH